MRTSTFTINGKETTLATASPDRPDTCLFSGNHPDGGIALLESDSPEHVLQITPAQLASLKGHSLP